MDAAARGGRRLQGQGNVDRLGLEPGIERGGLEVTALGLDQASNLGLEAVDGGAGALALFGGHGAERSEQRRDAPLLAQGADAYGIERGFIARFCDGGGKLGAEGGDLVLEGHGLSQLGRLRRLEQNKTPCASPQQAAQGAIFDLSQAGEC